MSEAWRSLPTHSTSKSAMRHGQHFLFDTVDEDFQKLVSVENSPWDVKGKNQ